MINDQFSVLPGILYAGSVEDTPVDTIQLTKLQRKAAALRKKYAFKEIPGAEELLEFLQEMDVELSKMTEK